MYLKAKNSPQCRAHTQHEFKTFRIFGTNQMLKYTFYRTKKFKIAFTLINQYKKQRLTFPLSWYEQMIKMCYNFLSIKIRIFKNWPKFNILHETKQILY